MTSFLDMIEGGGHVPVMAPEIRVIVLDTTGPTEILRVETWPRARALEAHGLPQKRKSPPRREAGRAKLPEFLRG